MSRRLIFLSALLTASAVITGCFFFGTRREPPITWDELQQKQQVTFAAPYDKVWDAALSALTTQKIEEVDKESGLISTRERSIAARDMDSYAWHPSYGNFWYYQRSGALDECRYWINLKVSQVAEDTTRVQITPNFEIHVRDWTWDTTSAMVWERVRSRGVMEDVIAGRIARSLGE